MKSKPCPCSLTASSTVGTRRPRLLSCLLQALATVAIASVKSLWSNWPGMPSEQLRSKWPTQRQSTPSTAAIASAFCDALAGLDLGEQRRPAVGLGELVHGRPGQVAIVRDAERHAAPAERHVLHAVEDLAGFFGRADHRQHDALGAHVGGARDVMVFLRRHAHDRRQVGRLHVAQHALDGLEAEAGMLGVEQGEIAAGGLEDLADPGRRELDDEVPELQLARTCAISFKPGAGIRSGPPVCCGGAPGLGGRRRLPSPTAGDVARTFVDAARRVRQSPARGATCGRQTLRGICAAGDAIPPAAGRPWASGRRRSRVARIAAGRLFSRSK